VCACGGTWVCGCAQLVPTLYEDPTSLRTDNCIYIVLMSTEIMQIRKAILMTYLKVLPQCFFRKSKNLCQNHNVLFTDTIPLGSIPIRGRDFFTTAPRLALGPTKPPRGSLATGEGVGAHQGSHSPPSNVKIKNTWKYTSSPSHILMVWCLIKHRGNFTSIQILSNC